MSLKLASRWVWIPLALILASPLTGFVGFLLYHSIYWNVIAPEIRRDFHNWPDYKNEDVLFSSSYFGMDMREFRLLASEAGFKCKLNNTQLKCLYREEKLILDVVNWVINAKADDSGKITHIRGYKDNLF